MNLKRMTDKAKQAIAERGGTERLKEDAERLRGIASGPGTAKDKLKHAGDALRQPRPDASRDTAPGVDRPDAPADGRSGPA